MSRRLSIRTFIAAALLVAACACSSSDDSETPGTPTGPTSPPPPSGVANVSGSWNGTADFEQANNQRLITTVSVTVTQSDRLVQGTVRFTAAGWESWRGTFSGALTGAVDTEFLGTVSLQSEPLTGSGTCSGSMSMFGRVTTNMMRWEAPALNMVASTPSEQPACLGQVRNIAWIFNR